MIIIYFVKLVNIFCPRQLQKEQFLENTAEYTYIIPRLLLLIVYPDYFSRRLTMHLGNGATSNLIMQNDPHAQSKLKSSNVIYRFSCPHEVCPLRPRNCYIGYIYLYICI